MVADPGEEEASVAVEAGEDVSQRTIIKANRSRLFQIPKFEIRNPKILFQITIQL
jgi:hypothetical protein